MGKNLDPNLKPEKQHTIPKQGSKERLCIGHGRAGSRRKRPDPISQSINQPSNLSQKILGRTEIEKKKNKPHAYQRSDTFHKQCNWQDENNSSLIPDVPVYRPLPEPIKQDMSYSQSSQSSTNIEKINPNINFAFEEKSPFQVGTMSETFQRPDKSFFSRAKRIKAPHK